MTATPRRHGRHRAAPHGQEGAPGARSPARPRGATPPGTTSGTVDLEPTDLRPGAQPRRAAPGGHGPAGRRPGRDPVDQDPGRGARRRRQAVPPEGHRPGPPGFEPLAVHERRRRGPRAQAAQLRAAHPQEDGAPGPALRARATGPTIGRITVVDDWKIEAPKTKDAATVLRKLKLDRHACWSCSAHDEMDVERSFANLPAGADHHLRRALGPRRAAHRLAPLLRRARCPRPPRTSPGRTVGRRGPAEADRPRSTEATPAEHRRARGATAKPSERPAERRGRRGRGEVDRGGDRGGRRAMRDAMAVLSSARGLGEVLRLMEEGVYIFVVAPAPPGSRSARRWSRPSACG